MSVVLPDLPYGYDALAPHVSAQTLRFHHDKHHRTYVDNVNKLVQDGPLANKSLVEIVKHAAAGGSESAGLFNNAAQAWNHDFYWRSMRPGGGTPRGAIAARIDADLGGGEAFAKQFAAAAMGQFGSGWAWLVLDGGRLKITKTANGDTPLVHGQAPLLTIDVWEHAYYLDYQNRRADYVAAVIAHLLDWDFAAANLAAALAGPSSSRAAAPARAAAREERGRA
jgi:Fe-Mn family superoxide dismutase